ncbi:MAG: hypothetical protein GY925_17645 [Actinomycetia bacterium]|nr:hypothetical protein [Actinomycetes bacterium]
MARPLSSPWPTAYGTVFFDDVASAPTLRRGVNAGRIRRLASHIYTADLETPAGELVERNIWQIVGFLMPDGVVVDRTASCGGEVVDGIIVVSTDERKSHLDLPGVTVLVRPLERMDDDFEWVYGLQMSSPSRTIVDNMKVSRSVKGRVPRTLTQTEMQWWAKDNVTLWGEDADQIAQKAMTIAQGDDVVDAADVAALFGIDFTAAEIPADHRAVLAIAGAVRSLGGDPDWSGADVHVGSTADELIDMLRALHTTVCATDPGAWRGGPNRLPSLEFVAADDVEVMLRAGFAMTATIPEALARSVGVLFVVLLVDPFADATEEVALLLMNTELSDLGGTPMIVPRNLTADYEAAKRRAILKGEVVALHDVLSTAARRPAHGGVTASLHA